MPDFTASNSPRTLNVDLPVPDEVLNWRVSQFQVLEGLDYPVGLREVSKRTAEDAYEAAEIDSRARAFYNHRFQKFQRWLQPQVHDRDFYPWVAGDIHPDLSAFNLDKEVSGKLARHPGAVLPRAVDEGLFKKVSDYHTVTGDTSPPMSVKEGPLPWYGQFIRGCYMTAVRRLLAKAELSPVYAQVDEGFLNRQHQARFRSFLNNGVVDVDNWHLRTFIKDYYLMLGAAIPDFASFAPDSP